jgi:hypothetical protein
MLAQGRDKKQNLKRFSPQFNAAQILIHHYPENWFSRTRSHNRLGKRDMKGSTGRVMPKGYD